MSLEEGKEGFVGWFGGRKENDKIISKYKGNNF